MAHQARLGACYLNTTYLGLQNQDFQIFVNGVDRSGVVDLRSFSMSCRQDGPCTVTFDVVGGITVTEGQEVVVRDGGVGTDHSVGVVLARARVVQVAQVYGQRGGEEARDRITANDVWFLDRFDRVTKIYTNQTPGAIVSDILTNHTDGDYVAGEIGSTTPLSITFSFESVYEALRRVAKASNLHVLLAPGSQHVALVASVDDGHAITLDESEVDYWGFGYQTDLSQIRTRVVVEGRETKLAAAVSLGATTLTLDEVTDWDPAGGRGRLRGQEFTYTGVDPIVNQLTGVAGLVTDGAVADPVSIVVRKDDAAAQTALATILGGGASGIVTHYIKATDATASEAAAIATVELARYSDVIPAIRYQTRDRFTAIGKTVTVSRTTPRAVTASATIESLEVRTVGAPVTGDTRLVYAVSASPDELTLTDVLRKGT